MDIDTTYRIYRVIPESTRRHLIGVTGYHDDVIDMLKQNRDFDVTVEQTVIQTTVTDVTHYFNHHWMLQSES